MKILFSAEKFYPPITGAEYSVLTLFEEMGRQNKIEAICTHEKTEMTDYKGIKIYHVKTKLTKLIGWSKRYFLNKMWFRILDHFLENKKYDLVITHTTLVPASVSAAKKHGIPVLTFVRGYDHFCLSHLKDVKVPDKHNCLKHASWKYKLQYPFFKGLVEWHRKALMKSDILMANSKFVQSITKKWYGLNPEVIYPFVKLKNYTSKKRSPEYITLIRPVIRKGLEIFLKIADAMPDKKFLTVGDCEKIRQIKKRKNITYIPWMSDMKSVYAQTKILLLPSIWQEPFGRVAVEAMCNGIPCIVSDRGGPPEIVKDAGIIIHNIFDIDAWVNAIERLDDGNFYEELSKKSIEQVKEFDFKEQYIKFEKILKKV